MKTRQDLVKGVMEAEETHKIMWNNRKRETNNEREERLRLNRLRKKLRHEIDSYQMTLF